MKVKKQKSLHSTKSNIILDKKKSTKNRQFVWVIKTVEKLTWNKKVQQVINRQTDRRTN